MREAEPVCFLREAGEIAGKTRRDGTGRQRRLRQARMDDQTGKSSADASHGSRAPAAAAAPNDHDRLLNTPVAAIVDLLPDAVFLYDARGHIVRTNATTRHLFALDSVPGYGSLPSAERARLVAPRALDGRALAEDQWHISRLLRGEVIHSAQPMVARVRGLDGAEHVFSYTGAPIHDEDGVIVGAIAVSRDVTEQERHDREREREAFAAQAAQLAATFDALSDGLVLFDAGGHLERMNAAAQSLLSLDTPTTDYNLSDRTSSSRYDVRDERGAPLGREQWPISRILAGDTLAGGRAQDIVLRALDGTARQLSISGAPVRDERGTITGAVCILHDVTEHRRLERRTREALDALLTMARATVALDAGTIMQASKDGAGAEADGAPQQLARLACGIIGCARTGIVALDEQERLVPVAIAGAGIGTDEQAQWHRVLHEVPLAHFVPPEIIATLRDGHSMVLDTTASPRREAAFGTTTALIVPMRVGERLIGTLALDSGRPARDYTDDDHAVASAVAQLTALVLERERLLREAAEAQAALLALAETNRLMNEFLGIAGHELRTPLTAIRANAQLAAQMLRRATLTAGGTRGAPSTPGDLTVLLGRIEQQSRRQERLVNDLLDVARIESGELELRPARLDLVDLVREAVTEQRLVHPKRTIRLVLPHTEAFAPVSADADRISQVVSNYLSNALKYSAARQPVAVAVLLQSRRVKVEVRDRGPGLAPDEHTRVWERFHRVPGVEVRSGSGIGMGLGLHISKSIVERHGGSVGVESAPGEGCTFWFTLPLLRVRARPDHQQGR